MATRAEITWACGENYHERGIRVATFAEEERIARAIKMLVKR